MTSVFGDITRGDIQQYLVETYASSSAPPHQPLTSTENRCALTTNTNTGTTPLLSFPQSVVHTIMKGMATTPSTNRGLLVLASTGSGKTLTAMATMDAFWDTKKNIVFATSVEASNSNPPSNFHKLGKFFPRFKGFSQEQVKKAFEKRKVKFFTFATLAHHLLIANPLKRVKSNADVDEHTDFLKDAVLVIDEVHNIFKPLPNQRLENDALKNFLLDYENPHTTDLKIVILTATPGDSPSDIVALLNMVRDRKNAPILVPDTKNSLEMSAFGQSIRGLVSYFDMSGDHSRFPRVLMDRTERKKMSTKQYLKYADTFLNEPNTVKNANALLGDNRLTQYYKHARRYSNMLYDMEEGMTIQEFSSKLPALLENIQKYPNEKHYVYSSFYENRGYGGHGIVAIAKALETFYKYEKLTVAAAEKQRNGFVVPRKPRYVLAISTELAESREKLNALVTAFNRPENARGDFVRVFLASQGYNEGIDLKGVRHVHIFEPLLTMASEKQTIGRAARFCSHSDLNRDAGEWTVRVHKYISEEPEDLSQFNLNYFRDRLDFLRNDLELKVKKVESIKNAGPGYKSLLNKFDVDVKEARANIAELEKKFVEIEKLDLKNVANINTKVTNEARERSRDMIAMDNVLRTSAVDYLLFKDYHGQAS